MVWGFVSCRHSLFLCSTTRWANAVRRCCTCFSVWLCVFYVQFPNESEKRTRRRRQQGRRKSWYADGDNIVWSRIACAFSSLLSPRAPETKPLLLFGAYKILLNASQVAFRFFGPKYMYRMHCSSTVWYCNSAFSTFVPRVRGREKRALFQWVWLDASLPLPRYGINSFIFLYHCICWRCISGERKYPKNKNHLQHAIFMRIYCNSWRQMCSLHSVAIFNISISVECTWKNRFWISL